MDYSEGTGVPDRYSWRRLLKIRFISSIIQEAVDKRYPLTGGIVMKTRIALLMLGLTALILLPCTGCGDDDDPVSAGDITSPSAVTDLRVESIAGSVVNLAWTAPGDDGDAGTASEYDIRYFNDPITESNWAAGTQVPAEPEPAAAGTEQSAAINTGGGADVHFALKAADEVPNWSDLSNVVMAPMGGASLCASSPARAPTPSPPSAWVRWCGYA